MSVKHILLGALMEAPDYGYGLKSRFFSKVVAQFGVNDGQLYPALKKMETEGLLRKEVEYQEGSPNRIKYYITDAGKAEFLRWIESDNDDDGGFKYDIIRKDPFLNRCIYLNHLPKEKVRAKVAKEMELARNAMADFTRSREEMTKHGVIPLRLKIIGYCLMQQETRLKWLEELHDSLDDMSLNAKDR